MYSVSTFNNNHNLEDFALAMCIVQDENAPRPKGEPKLLDIEIMARGVIVSHDLTVKAAFETILHLRRNLQTKIRYDDGSVRLLSSPNILSIAKNAMELLKTVFVAYEDRLRQLDQTGLAELGRRIAGVFHRDPVVNVVTGYGIHFTGLSKLYYERTRLNKYETVRTLLGFSKNNIGAIFYSHSFPTLQEIERVVSNVMGPPSQRQPAS